MPSSPSASEEESDNEVDLPPKVGRSTIKLKLPKLVLPKFNGDVTQFRSFWDSFKSAIDGNKDLSEIDKFNYLHALLEGAASRAIQGLPLSKANQKIAVQIIEEQFGRPQQIISAHMEDLLKIPSCCSDKTSHLHSVYDKIHINV